MVVVGQKGGVVATLASGVVRAQSDFMTTPQTTNGQPEPRDEDNEVLVVESGVTAGPSGSDTWGGSARLNHAEDTSDSADDEDDDVLVV